MLCRESELSLWTLNGHLMIEKAMCDEDDDVISSCAFYEGNGNEFLERQLIFTGHKRGVVNVGVTGHEIVHESIANTYTDLEHAHSERRVHPGACETYASYGSGWVQH